MRIWVRSFLFLSALIVTQAANALTLHIGDLVAYGTPSMQEELGIYRIDGSTGVAELISSGGAYNDIAVVGTDYVYAASDSSLVEIDVATGSARSLVEGWDSMVGVAVNRIGDVFAVRQTTSFAPHGAREYAIELWEVDRLSGERSLASSIGTSAHDGVFRSVVDVELLNDDTVVAMTDGITNVYALDRRSPNGSHLVGNVDTATAETHGVTGPDFSGMQGMGISATGRVLAATGSFRDTGIWAYDPMSEVLELIGTDVLVLDDSGTTVNQFRNLDITETGLGDAFVTLEYQFPVQTPEYFGIHPFVPGACPLAGPGDTVYSGNSHCMAGADGAAKLIDGQVFSAGQFTEIQAVLIPEPSTGLIVGVGLWIVARRPHR